MQALQPKTRRLHRGDIMSAAKRSALMSKIRGKDTKPEKLFDAILRSIGVEFETHCRDLPGRPDFVLRDQRIAVFIDGDFWHGWRFPAWRLKLSKKWEEKIDGNRRRDVRNHRRLRRSGWKVIRIWEHQIENSPETCATRLKASLPAHLFASTNLDNVVSSVQKRFIRPAPDNHVDKSNRSILRRWRE